jgi:hypothetical protein
MGTDLFHAAALLVRRRGRTLAGRQRRSARARLVARSARFPGVLLGACLSLTIPEQLLRFTLAGVLGLAGIELVGIPEADVVAAVRPLRGHRLDCGSPRTPWLVYVSRS